MGPSRRHVTQSPPGTVVVGVDGSAGADRSLAWAVRQAVLEGRPLTVVHAMDLLGPGQTTLPGPSLVGPPELFDALTRTGRGVLDRAVRDARAIAPALEMYDVLSQAAPRSALVAESSRAHMVVTGSRGRGPVPSLLFGSVGVSVSMHAECPTVVVRSRESGALRRGILVCVDGADQGRDAVAFAFRLASRHGVPLTVVHCLLSVDDEQTLLREAVRSLTEDFPDVHLNLETTRGSAAQRLVESSRTMDVIVLGSPRPSLLHPHLGSHTATVVRHARCVVAVIPVATEPQRRGGRGLSGSDHVQRHHPVQPGAGTLT